VILSQMQITYEREWAVREGEAKKKETANTKKNRKCNELEKICDIIHSVFRCNIKSW
jgi:hypothetical protein